MVSERTVGACVSRSRRAAGVASSTSRRGRSAASDLLALLAYALLGIPLAHSADPQPYKVDWASSGNSQIDSLMKLTSQLEALRTTAPVGPYGLIARARGDVPRLQTVLESFGYYQGTIAITINGVGLDSAGLGDALTALPKGSDAHVRISPTLGPLFRIGRISINGTLPPGMRQKLDLAPGAPAVASDVLAAGAGLQGALQDAGYVLAKVSQPIAYEDPPRHLLDLTFRVTSGPRVRIGDIHVQGLKTVHESLVRRRLIIHAGELYDAATVEKARQSLLALGVFSSVSVRLGRPDQERRVPITFVVQEAKRYTVGVSGAYSSDLGGSAGLNWSDRNVFGNGQQLSISATAIDLGGTASTGLGYDATIGYTIPDFRRPDQTLSYSLAAIRQALQAYTQTGETAGTSLSRKLSKVWNVSAGVSFEHEIIGQEGILYDYNVFLLPFTASYDSTDVASPLVQATQGFKAWLNVTPTFSYDTKSQFIVMQGSIATYYDLHKLLASRPPGRSVVAVRAISGVALNATQFSLPPDQRFYAGGSGTVRGYRYQSVGPEFSDGNPKGGTNMQAVNLDLLQRIGASFGIVVFTDAGGVSSPSGSVYRVGVGTGALYYTSIGPIRFEIGLPTRRRPNDDRFEVYIGLGPDF